MNTNRLSALRRAAVLACALFQVYPATAAELAAGGYHTLFIEDGQVMGVGDGTYGQLGTTPDGSPATVAGLASMTEVAAGGFTTLALKSDGTVWYLGETTVQHTTTNGTPNPVSSPIQIQGLSGIDAIAAGHRHFLALDRDTGQLFAWGHNGSGQLGNGLLQDIETPVSVLGGVETMSAGEAFSIAVKTDGTVWSWGANHHGQLGLGDTSDRVVPTQMPGITSAAEVAAGGTHTLIRLDDGSVLATGANSFGQLGRGTTTSSSTPAPVPGLTSIGRLSAGFHHSAALTTSGNVFLWGRNFEGQCGGGPTAPVTYTSPISISALPGPVSAVVCGYQFTVFTFTDADLWGCGSNSDGQLDGVTVADQSSSPKILTPQSLPIGPDIYPPTPNPSSFLMPPAAFDGTSIMMTANTAADPSGPVQYFFENTSGGGNDSGWQSSSFYQDSGLTPGASCGYRVKARDPLYNETDWSPVAHTTAAPDTAAPAPNPMSFTSPPAILGGSSITMTASTASDPTGVEYYFENTAGGGNDSGWQQSPSYTDTGVAPGIAYSYRVRARDKSANQNMTAFSAEASAIIPIGGVLLETDFTGRTVNGKTAGNIPWSSTGFQSPGDLTFVPGGGAPTNTSLFDGSNAQGYFAPDINIGTEGPWSVTVPLSLTTRRIRISNIVIGWRHFGNTGSFQTQARSANWTASIIGSDSDLFDSATVSNVSGISGITTLAFDTPLVIDDTETYLLRIDVEGYDTTGNNAGLDSIAINGEIIPVAEEIPNLLAHYAFDTSNGTTTPDSAPGSSAFATLNNLVINTTSGMPKAGPGALEMNGAGTGAITSNSFSWSASDIRSISFWWRAKTPNADTIQGTYISMGGSGTSNYGRFDLRENEVPNSSTLRLETQGGSISPSPAIDDGTWHFITVIVPNETSTLGEVRGYLDGDTGTDLFAGNTSTTHINTITSALVFGGSVLGGRVPNGYLDDFQMYGGALTATQIQFLYQNPGLVLGEDPDSFSSWTASFNLPANQRGFNDDPDGDGLASGVEAWFGTHPGEFSPGLDMIQSDGITTTFQHPLNPDPPSGITGTYNWSPDLIDWYPTGSGPPGGPFLTITRQVSGGVATVSVTSSQVAERVFLRVRVIEDP
jgi:alpha-tubulin suppressor-like RCC1 family protein